MKILFAVLFTVFVIGQSEGNLVQTHQYVQDRSADGLKETAEEALKKLQQLVTDTINNAIAQIENIRSNIETQFNDLKQKIIDAAKKQFDDIIAKFDNQVIEWKKKAEALGVDVKDCYVKNEQALLDLPKLAFQKMLSCITNEYDTVMNLINSTETLIKGIIDQVVAIQNRLKQCSGFDIPCYYDVIAKCTSLTFSVVTNVAGKVTDVSTFVTGLQARLQICATTQATSVSLEAASITKTIVDCIQNKIMGKAFLLNDF